MTTLTRFKRADIEDRFISTPWHREEILGPWLDDIEDCLEEIDRLSEEIVELQMRLGFYSPTAPHLEKGV